MNVPNIALDVRSWILTAIVLGLLFGDVFGSYDTALIMIFLMIMMCFSLTRLEFAKNDLTRYGRAIAVSVFLCTFLATAITLGVGMFFGDEMWGGWVILACVPCAISVVSATIMMEGDGKMITVCITAIYILAILTTPLFSYLLLGDAIDPLEIVKYVLLFILIPFIISFPLKKVGVPKDINSLIINASFFVFAFIGVGRSRGMLIDDTSLALLVLLASFVRIFVVLIVFEYITRYAGVPRERRIPYSLLLIWRNSGLALAMVILLLPGNDTAHFSTTSTTPPSSS